MLLRDTKDDGVWLALQVEIERMLDSVSGGL
jgi:hypothetical protein